MSTILNPLRRPSMANATFTDIFRPTQDIDLVVDGEIAKVKNFGREVLEHLPDIKGNKQTWEVRTLREDYGEKLALLNNPNFFNQHTDSHSVGMISLSKVDENKVVRDLLDWKADNPRFLQDVLANKLHYYYSAHHSETLRFQQGKNPPIISVVRYFIKLFQHELEMSNEDLKKLQKIIMGFNPQEIRGSYTERWLQGNVPKLFLHSRNVEYSWDMLEQTGLRAKLLKVGDINETKSPAWWANKSPLRSFELGKGKGKTAAQLEIKTVAHDTSDFFLWTVITRSRKGEANVFESRPDAVGEMAVHGRGFYTIKNSRRGAYGNGFSISFAMHPKAREGVDFKVEGQYGFSAQPQRHSSDSGKSGCRGTAGLFLLTQGGRAREAWRYWKKCAGGWILNILRKPRLRKSSKRLPRC